MSLEPHWFSTIFGMLFIGGQGLGALAFVIAVAYLLSRPPAEFARVLAPTHSPRPRQPAAGVRDAVGVPLVLAVPDHLGGQPAGGDPLVPATGSRAGGTSSRIALAVFYFVGAVLRVLLSRKNKRQHRRLATIALAIIVARLLDVFWLIAPEFYERPLTVHWMDVAAIAASAGCGCAFLWRLGAAAAAAERPGLAARSRGHADASRPGGRLTASRERALARGSRLGMR